MLEHGYVDNQHVEDIEILLLPGSKWYKQRIVWAGDYAPFEERFDYNLNLCNCINLTTIDFISYDWFNDIWV